MSKIEKYIKDGNVAILVSPGFGAGWSTWANKDAKSVLFDPYIVDLLLSKKKGCKDDIAEYCEKKYPDLYLGGLFDLEVRWLPQGTRFVVQEYDGSESIETIDEMPWETA